MSRGYLLLNKSPSQPTLLFRFSTRVSITRPGQLVNTAMAEVIKVWQDYLGQPLDHGAVTDDDELLASAVNNLIKTIGSLSYDDILLRTQVVYCLSFIMDTYLCVAFILVLILICMHCYVVRYLLNDDSNTLLDIAIVDTITTLNYVMIT